MEERIESLFSTESLRWILRISLQLRCSSPCSGLAASNDDSWWPLVVVGGGGGGVRAFGLRLRGKRAQMCNFMLLDVLIIYRSRLASSSR